LPEILVAGYLVLLTAVIRFRHDDDRLGAIAAFAFVRRLLDQCGLKPGVKLEPSFT